MVERMKGRAFSLINSRVRCKVVRCGGQGFFVAASGRDGLLYPLVNKDRLYLWTIGPRPRDFEPPEQPSPIPPGGMRVRS